MTLQRSIHVRSISSGHGSLKFALVVAGVFAVGAMGVHAEESRRPREPLTKLDSLTKPSFPAHLIVKFRDDMKVRADSGGLRSLTAADLSLPNAVRAQHGLTFEPLIRLPQATFDFLEKTAADRSGIEQPDLAGMMVVFGPDPVMEQAANALLALEEIEWAQFSALDPELPSICNPTFIPFCTPPCSDIAPNTPDYSGSQGWRGTAGVSLDSLRNSSYGPNARGAGIQIADVEQSYTCGHEDLCAVNMAITPHMFADARHGIAVLGILAATDTVNSSGNQYGVIGAVPDSEIWLFSEMPETGNGQLTPQTRATAIAAATAQLLSDGVSGDIQLFEIQTTQESAPQSSELAPAEIVADVFTLTKLATDAGVVVVEAAGNGAFDLDVPFFDYWRNWGDSGAIIVGGGTSNGFHDWYVGSWGTRVNVQAWGENVLTLGCIGGMWADPGSGDQNQWYTHFNGTSSASAIVAGVAAAIQSLADTQFACSLPTGTHQRLSPLQLRDLLINTGRSQGVPSTKHIGPIPNAVAAAITLHTLGIADNNTNGVDDICDIWAGTESDCNGNLVIDSVDIASGVVTDCNGNGVDDNCDPYGSCCQRLSPPFPPTYSCSATTGGLCCQQGGHFAGAGTKCATTDCATLPQ